ncbi:hypothetical protein Q5692_39920 [Microcoleus sp. C2C3]|uniref:hypothetical protein n=1 Tax=unclassified Microcoleus TaxID=2642155 RepID=UPI002FCECC43
MTRLIGDTDEQVPELAGKKWEQIYQTNDIARWLDDKVVLDPELVTHVGTNDETKTSSWLYASYCADRQEQNEKPISMKAFRPNLMDFLLNQLKVQVSVGEDRKGRFIKGLGLRCFHDPTGEIYPRPVTKKPFGGGGLMVDGGGCVVAESLGSGGWDGCDGLIENSKNTENTQPPPSPISPKNQNCDGDSGNNPQHPPNPPLPSNPATTQPSQNKKNPPQCLETIANKHFADILADRMREAIANSNREDASEVMREVSSYPLQVRGLFNRSFSKEESTSIRLLKQCGLVRGSRVKYVGKDTEQYEGEVLTVDDINAQNELTCLRPDGKGYTTWLKPSNLEKL